MPNRSSRPKRPRDLNQLAAAIIDAATADTPSVASLASGKDPLAVELGRRGGLKGGKARAAKLTPSERAEIARKAAQARWGSTTKE
jgi:hypothetical protein